MFSLQLRTYSIRLKQCKFYLPRQLSTASGYSATASDGPSASEISSARAYCIDLLRKYDSPSYTLLAFIPASAQPAYLAIRAFNLEIARIADQVSTPQVGALRLQFWKDNIGRTFAGSPPKQPVSLLLASALSALRTESSTGLSKSWFMRIIAAREQYLNNAPYATLEDLEKYAESTYSTLLYLTLQALPLHSVTADHLASHVGKAAGIVTVLRGLPLLAFPAPPNHHSNSKGLGMVEQQRSRAQQGVVTLPLDIMAEVGLREEDVLRKGAEAEGLRDAVFKVATRASDHLITARTMLESLEKGEDVGHAFEHEDEEEHQYELRQPRLDSGAGKMAQQKADIESAFGVLMPAVSTGLWLDKLQKLDFDIFREELRRREWKLPWKAYFANRRRMF
ncbi:hypothetical protein MMC17_003089 [Xylographa soralifera]|nr:hypothetical protein [Xylographa soralifera]